MSTPREELNFEEPRGCPLCGADWIGEERECAHLLAHYDLTFSGWAGDLDAGLCGGTLFNLHSLARLVDIAKHICMVAALDERTDLQQAISQLGGPLREFTTRLLDITQEWHDQSEQCSGRALSQELWSEAESHGDIVRELVASMLDQAGVAYGISTYTMDDAPGQSSTYENLWSENPLAAAAAIEAAAKKMLDSLRGLTY